MFEVRKDLAWDLSSSKYVFQVAGQSVDRDVQLLVDWLNSDEKVQQVMLLPQSREALAKINGLIRSDTHVQGIVTIPMMLASIN